VKFGQCAVTTDKYASPDHWADAANQDSELIDHPLMICPNAFFWLTPAKTSPSILCALRQTDDSEVVLSEKSVAAKGAQVAFPYFTRAAWKTRRPYFADEKGRRRFVSPGTRQIGEPSKGGAG